MAIPLQYGEDVLIIIKKDVCVTQHHNFEIHRFGRLSLNDGARKLVLTRPKEPFQ